jgi:hypothetical protein
MCRLYTVIMRDHFFKLHNVFGPQLDYYSRISRVSVRILAPARDETSKDAALPVLDISDQNSQCEGCLQTLIQSLDRELLCYRRHDDIVSRSQRGTPVERVTRRGV